MQNLEKKDIKELLDMYRQIPSNDEYSQILPLEKSEILEQIIFILIDCNDEEREESYNLIVNAAGTMTELIPIFLVYSEDFEKIAYAMSQVLQKGTEASEMLRADYSIATFCDWKESIIDSCAQNFIGAYSCNRNNASFIYNRVLELLPEEDSIHVFLKLQFERVMREISGYSDLNWFAAKSFSGDVIKPLDIGENK